MAVGNKEKLIIIGDGETAEIAYEYFTEDSHYEIVAFSAERNFMKNKTLFGLPVIPFEEIEAVFDPKKCKAFVAVSFTQLNRVRTRLLAMVKEKGYSLCSYISPRAVLGNNVEIGGNCFIFENVNLQRAVKISDNVTIWSGSSVGHHTVIRDNCFLASHVAVSGFCDVGENCFLGVNCCTVGNVKIAKDCIIGAGAVIIGDTQEGRVYVGNPAKPLPNKKVSSFISGQEII